MASDLHPHAVGPMGWEIPTVNATVQEKIDHGKRETNKFAMENPVVYQQREAQEMLPAMKKKWDDFQVSKGRAPGSNDLSLIVEFVFGTPMPFYPQDGGTCVWSNTFRVWIERMCFEICLRGDPEAYIGSTQYGLTSIAPHCVTYGMAREIAKMKGGWGLYKAPMIKALSEGVVLCSTPKVLELHKAAGSIKDDDYPEPRNLNLYHKIGDWAWNAALRPYLCCALKESVDVNNVDEHKMQEDQSKPMIQCSGIAIKKIGTHKDGFDIHGVDPRDSWGHCMGWSGFRLSSDGNRFRRLSNRSWTPKGGNPENYVYNIPPEEMAKIYKIGVDTASIGEIDGLPVVYPSV